MATSLPVGTTSSVPYIPRPPGLPSRPGSASLASPNRIERFEKHLAGKSLSLFKAAAEWSSAGSVPGALRDMPDVKIADASSAAERWTNAIEGEAQMTLPAMTTILKDFFQEARDQRCKNLLLVGESGQIILKPKNGSFRLYNSPELPMRLAAIEVHPAIDEQLTLSVLKGLYGDRAVANLLQEQPAEPENPADPNAAPQVDGNGNEAPGVYGIYLARTLTSDTDASDSHASDTYDVGSDLESVPLPEAFVEHLALLRPHISAPEPEPSSVSTEGAPDDVDTGFPAVLNSDQLHGAEPEAATNNVITKTVAGNGATPLAEILVAIADFRNDVAPVSAVDAETLMELSDAFYSLDRIRALASNLDLLQIADVEPNARSVSLKNDLREFIREFISALAKPDHPWPVDTKEKCITILADIKTHIDRELGSPVITTDMPIEMAGPRGDHSPEDWHDLLTSTGRQAGLRDIDNGPRFTEAQTAKRYRIRPEPTIDPRELDLEIEQFNQTVNNLRKMQDVIRPHLDEIIDSFSSSEPVEAGALATVRPYVSEYSKSNIPTLSIWMKDSHDAVEMFRQKWDKPMGREKLVVNVDKIRAREQIDAVLANQKKQDIIFAEILIKANERSSVTGEDIAHMTFAKVHHEPTMASANRATDHLPGRA
jgi:hypothetical protein